MQTEFGRISTTNEEILYAILLEQRKTNELLQSLVPKAVEPKPTVAPEKKAGVK